MHGADWADAGPVVREITGIGRVEQRLAVTAVDLPLVSFRPTYTFAADGTVVVSDSTIRFRGQSEIESVLVSHGYRVRDICERRLIVLDASSYSSPN